MPELPEVETVMRGITPHLAGRRITAAKAFRPNLRFAFPDRFAERLTGAEVLSLRRRAKYILIELSTGETWLSHLGMTGRFRASLSDDSDLSAPKAKAHHFALQVEGGARLDYYDPRRFGFMDLFPSDQTATHPNLAALGPEPLGANDLAEHLAARFKDRAQPLKSALLDQQNVAGLGNIYVCEALYRSGLHPETRAGAISSVQVGVLAQQIRDVLNDAINAGGSTLKDFSAADGELGYFQHSFDVYGREGEPCKRTGCSGAVERIVQSGRSSFFCTTCQARI